jgi:hypothetical protein
VRLFLCHRQQIVEELEILGLTGQAPEAADEIEEL